MAKLKVEESLEDPRLYLMQARHTLDMGEFQIDYDYESLELLF